MTQQEKYLEGSRRKLEEKALAYARMKFLGEYISNEGNRCKICMSDHEHQISFYKDLLAYAAEDLFTEISMIPLPERKTNGI